MSEIIGYDASNVLQRLEITSGKVGISALPSLIAGSAAIGKLAANAGVNIGEVSVSALPALVAGSAAIGKLAANAGVNIGEVSVSALPALVAGTAKVGQVALLANEAADGSGTERNLLCDSGGRLQVDVIAAPTTAVTFGKTSTVTTNITVTSVAAGAATALSDSTELDLTASRDIYVYGDTTDSDASSSVRLWVSSTSGGTFYGTSEVGVYDQGYLGFKVNDLAAKYAKLVISNYGAGTTDFNVYVAQM